ncbi:hypothetical protein FCV43_18475 [Vibrio genomosp. F6]|uniref:hypothetical protein n=1 Tax=Vibrio genomosp. F6 TaxID=723172 RepID=UPI0010BD48B7|nr:hypothetical protein [Vibrio genomosp. F6]TKF16250.1 hypothetical protein FCV43_18475 [Vibrio genomosp. F6]
MTLVSDLKNIDGLFTTTLLVLFLSVIAPGILVIYLFLPELFIELDSIKFILFAASLGLPVFALNSFFMPAVLGFDEDEEYDFQQVGVFGGMLSSFVLYSCLIISYVAQFTFDTFLLSVVVFEALWFVFSAFYYFKAKKVKNLSKAHS